MQHYCYCHSSEVLDLEIKSRGISQARVGHAWSGGDGRLADFGVNPCRWELSILCLPVSLHSQARPHTAAARVEVQCLHLSARDDGLWQRGVGPEPVSMLCFSVAEAWCGGRWHEQLFIVASRVLLAGVWRFVFFCYHHTGLLYLALASEPGRQCLAFLSSALRYDPLRIRSLFDSKRRYSVQMVSSLRRPMVMSKVWPSWSVFCAAECAACEIHVAVLSNLHSHGRFLHLLLVPMVGQVWRHVVRNRVLEMPGFAKHPSDRQSSFLKVHITLYCQKKKENSVNNVGRILSIMLCVGLYFSVYTEKEKRKEKVKSHRIQFLKFGFNLKSSPFLACKT